MTAEELKVLRKRLQMTQAQLAEKLGIHVLTVSRWERRVRKIKTPEELALRTIEREWRAD